MNLNPGLKIALSAKFELDEVIILKIIQVFCFFFCFFQCNTRAVQETAELTQTILGFITADYEECPIRSYL